MSYRCIGFIGVGVMGEPMCRHLAAKSGIEVLANDTTSEALNRLEAAGVKAVTQQAMLERADLIFLSLPSGAVVESVLLGPQGLMARARPGQTFVDLSTSAYDTARRLADMADSRELRFADAPVMRTRTAAEAGTLAVMVGADEATFRSIEPLIRSFATDVMHVGAPGAGQVVKILNNMVVYETVLALAEARAIATRVGISADTLFTAFATASADSFALRNQGFNAIAPQHFPLKAFPVTYARKDIAYAVALAEQVGVDASGARNLIDCFDEAIRSGWGDQYAPAISRVFERAAPARMSADNPQRH